MSSPLLLTTTEISAIFAEEIKARSGTVLDTFDDGSRLFTRSVFPWVREVRTDDRLQGGVALRATAEEIWVHPYVFRTVCSNGAIMAHSLHTEHLTGLSLQTLEEANLALRAALQACSAIDAFSTATREFRSALDTQVDLALNMLPALARMGPGLGAGTFQRILERYFEDSDRSRYGLTNAITSVARDTRDPELRWRLEELGGGVAAGKITTPPSSDSELDDETELTLADNSEAVCVA
jgi:hypothetical protein